MLAQYENHYLTDNDVANYARHSFADLADNFTPDQNNRLIQFLARGMASGDWESLINQMTFITDTDEAKKLAVYMRKIPEHWVPFGHPQITLRMQAPVPIARQSFKHKIGFVESEESRRYISCEPVVYMPDFWRAKAASVKQGSAGKHPDSDLIMEIYRQKTEDAVVTYLWMVDVVGICPEQARFILPQGCEVHWVWTGSLYAFSNFYNQRSDGHAQQEIQQLAAQVNDIITPLFPVAWPALTQGAY